MADKASDLVVTYGLHANGEVKGYDALQSALNDGFRVVEVIATPVSPGGAGTGPGFCAVTVVLTLNPGERGLWYKSR